MRLRKEGKQRAGKGFLSITGYEISRSYEVMGDSVQVVIQKTIATTPVSMTGKEGVH